MKKMTKREWYDVLLAMNEVQANAGAVDFINREKELLARKNSADRKPTAVQLRNEEIKEVILANLSKEEGKSVTALQKIVEKHFAEEFSNQKISALVRALVDDNKIVRVEEKRKALFFLA